MKVWLVHYMNGGGEYSIWALFDSKEKADTAVTENNNDELCLTDPEEWEVL